MSLLLDFGILNIILHQEGLLSLIAFSKSLQDQVAELMANKQRDRIASTQPKRQLSVISETAMDTSKGELTITKRNGCVINYFYRS